MSVQSWWCMGVCAVIIGTGCSNASSNILSLAPPWTGHGTCRRIVVSDYHGQPASRAVGRALAQVLRADAGSDHCATVLAVAADGHMLAYATVSYAHEDRSMAYRSADARALLAECLTMVHNWQTPTLQISSEEGARVVLAAAAFTRCVNDPDANHSSYRQSVCVVLGEPDLFMEVSGVPPQEAERIVTSGASSSVARRHQQAQATASR